MEISLRRYTELPYVLDFLWTGELALLNPRSWDDRNDSYFIEQYVVALGQTSAYALCLAESAETYHHWKVFSRGPGGACVEFDKDTFIESARLVPGLRAESVKYRTLKDVRASAPEQSELPFLKRFAFSDENEFRLFVTAKSDPSDVFRITMPICSIDRITLSPWLPKSAAEVVKRTIKLIPGCSKIKIYRSSLVDNDMWKKFANPRP